jgi:hypothetical protein
MHVVLSGKALLTRLEQRFPEMNYPDQNIDGIIALAAPTIQSAMPMQVSLSWKITSRWLS